MVARLIRHQIQLTFLFALCIAGTAAAQDGLVQVHQDFSTDPGWEGSVNRVEATDPPTVKQDFGWKDGKIGGTIWQSMTPAWYGMPLNPPATMNDPFNASGKIALLPGSDPRGVFYLGLFNHERQGWRPWSTIAIRIVKRDTKASFYIDHTTGLWEAGAAETETTIPIDGSEHTWKFSYDPNARRDEWTDMALYKALNAERQTIEDDILPKVRKTEPNVTAADLEKRLDKARSQGLVTYLPRWGKRFFVLKDDKVELKGAVTVQIDNDPPVKTFLEADMLKAPTVMDRFGIYNFQLYHGSAGFNIWDLTVNGKKIDLSTDPGWDGKGNRDTFVERDFQRQNFGYSPDTNFAGGQKGEIGGTFYNVEPNDPLHGHYADEIGKLTLDDPLQFSGKIYFHEGATDAGMFFGYFRAEDQVRELPPNVSGGYTPGWPQPNVLGVVVDGPARIGWWFIPYCAASIREQHADKTGHLFYPIRKPRTFDFVYDPKANDGVGQVTVTLDGEKPFTMNLTPEMRKTGATFDRFGLMSFRRGGKYSTLYWDDLTYTARRSKDYVPVRHKQEITKVPYPKGGRKF
jgi:hypothetical protein